MKTTRLMLKFQTIWILGNGHGSDGKYYYSGDFDIPLDQDGVRMKDILLDMMVAFAKTGLVY